MFKRRNFWGRDIIDEALHISVRQDTAGYREQVVTHPTLVPRMLSTFAP